MDVSLVWATPNGDDLVSYMARVSNPNNQENFNTAPRLIKYLIDHKHWSPFEMVDACVEINTTRDIAHQLIRHRSFSFQEFSGRYAAYDSLNSYRECRLQDNKNRQNSLPANNSEIELVWDTDVALLSRKALEIYKGYLDIGVAKEVVRSILPEGLVPTKIYMKGSLRSWLHYWDVRCGSETQKEHRLVAEASREIVLKEFPLIKEAYYGRSAEETSATAT